MMERDVADDPHFAEFNLPKNKYRDLVTPYGYGGFVFNQVNVPTEIISLLNSELSDFLKEKGYVAAFFRFHPVLSNALIHSQSVNVIDLGHTIAIDLTSPETIWNNITSKNRNMIRKAEKNGIVIKHGKGMDLLKQFVEIYNATMDHDEAAPYYYFELPFYESIDSDLRDNYEVFYAECEGKIVAMSIMIFAGTQMHYHLSGSLFEYRNLAPSNLLLYQAALWGCEKGYRTFHLGGGVGSGKDNLYKFKAGFNRNSDYTFSIGKMIISHIPYEELVKLRAFTEFQLESVSFFPAYRAMV